jgi:hypothetical protein
MTTTRKNSKKEKAVKTATRFLTEAEQDAADVAYINERLPKINRDELVPAGFTRTAGKELVA